MASPDRNHQATRAGTGARVGDAPSMDRVAVVSEGAEPGERLCRGFARAGAATFLASRASELETGMPDPDVIVLATRERGATLATLAALRAISKTEAPILIFGGGGDREAAMATGAAGWIADDSDARDVVTAATLLWNDGAESGTRLETLSGIYYLARALYAQRRSCVVTVTRGLRRGELAFVDGELSRASIGMLHGLSAFHQLLLWTRGALQIRDQNELPHGEIPLAFDELYAEAKRFLAEIRDAAGPVSPGSVYEQQTARAGELLGAAPEPVVAVWRLFDGSRTVADVAEDSPYRVVETFRIAAKLAETQTISRCQKRPRRSRAQAILALEEWLTGTADAKASETAPKTPVDWSAVVPLVDEPPVGSSPVVPSASASGEIQSPEVAVEPEPFVAPDPPEPEPPIAASLTAALSDAEAAFFERGEEIERNPSPPVDTFEDLDIPPDPEGTRKRLWARLRTKSS